MTINRQLLIAHDFHSFYKVQKSVGMITEEQLAERLKTEYIKSAGRSFRVLRRLEKNRFGSKTFF